jgi:hypothetical protein
LRKLAFQFLRIFALRLYYERTLLECVFYLLRLSNVDQLARDVDCVATHRLPFKRNLCAICDKMSQAALYSASVLSIPASYS